MTPLTEMIQFGDYWNDPVLVWNDPIFQMIQNDNTLQQSTIRWWCSGLADAYSRYIEIFVESHAEEALGFILVMEHTDKCPVIK